MSMRIAPTLRMAARRMPAARAPVVAAPVFRRGYASDAPPPPPKQEGGSKGLLIAAGLIAAAGVGYYMYDQQNDPNVALAKDAKKTEQDYQKIYDRIADTLEKEGYDDGSLAPIVLRLAWHASGTYDKDTKTGGSNYATMRFPTEGGHGANAGLAVARDYLEEIHKDFPWISYGDLWTLAGVAAVQEMGGPTIPWRPGRIDGTHVNQTPDGRLPDASKKEDHIREIFNRMGFDDQEMVALIGAHALGRCHTDRSGYDGPWTFSPTTFSNDFYVRLLNDKWSWKKWKGPDQYEDKTKSLMMLPTDMALVKDKKFRKYVEEYAKDEDKFFNDYAKAYAKLLELGVPKDQWQTEPYHLKAA